MEVVHFRASRRLSAPLPSTPVVWHFTWTQEGRGASAGHSGIPIGTWMVAAGQRRAGQAEEIGDV